MTRGKDSNARAKATSVEAAEAQAAAVAEGALFWTMMTLLVLSL